VLLAVSQYAFQGLVFGLKPVLIVLDLNMVDVQFLVCVVQQVD
jgi:hypothetical protein